MKSNKQEYHINNNEYRHYVLGNENIIPSSMFSHMFVILEDGLVKQFIFELNIAYEDFELEPIPCEEVGNSGHWNSRGAPEYIYETTGDCTLEEFEKIFIDRHNWRFVQYGKNPRKD